MNVSDIPDYTSPIVGYRVWLWHAVGLSSFNGEAWLPGRALTAKCSKTDHQSPIDDCSCGVYAAKSHEQLQKIYSSEFVVAFVHGEVNLWGKLVEHAHGYRAQFAYPKSFVLPSNIDPRWETSRLKSLMVYGADIYIPPNVLLWTKNSGYTHAGFDWLAERRKPFCERCKKWHGRIQLGDSVTLLGRGIGLVERDDGSSGCTSDSVCVRLGNNDLFIVPFDDMVWDCQNSRWEVELSGYKGAVILPSSKGWKVLCGLREQKSSDKTPLLPNPVRHRISTPPKSRELSILRPRISTPPKSRGELSILRPRLYRSSSPGSCGVCGSFDVPFDSNQHPHTPTPERLDMSENDFNEIMMLLDRLQCELYSEAKSVSPTERLQRYFGNWLLTRVRLHVTATYSSCLTYGSYPSHSSFYVNDSGFRLILADCYLLYAVNTANGLMYVYDTERWVEWIRRIDTKVEEMFLYSDKRTPRPLLANQKDGTHLALEAFLREGPRPWFD